MLLLKTGFLHLKWAWDNTIGAIHEMVTDSQGKIRESYRKLCLVK